MAARRKKTEYEKLNDALQLEKKHIRKIMAKARASQKLIPDEPFLGVTLQGLQGLENLIDTINIGLVRAQTIHLAQAAYATSK